MGWDAWEPLKRRKHGVLAIAHRGGMAEAAENSLAAFHSAVALGFRFMEVDLRASADGSLYVRHGTRMERLRPNRPLDPRRLESGSNQLLLFEQVLEELPQDVAFFVDVKNRPACEALAGVLRRTGGVARICVGSFSGLRTKLAAAAIERETGRRPSVALAPRGVARLLLYSLLGTSAWQAPAPSAQIPAWLARRRVITAAHRGGVLVLPWTVNDERDMHRLLDRGVDGLMTDHPAKLKAVLIERGQWAEPRS